MGSSTLKAVLGAKPSTRDGATSEVSLSTWLSKLHLVASLLLVTAVVGGLVWISARHDELARSSAEEMVKSKVSYFERSKREMTADNSIWTEAYDAIQNGDIEWLYDNVGTATLIGTADLVAFVPRPGAEPIGWLADTPPEGTSDILPPETIEAVLDRLSGSDPDSQVVENAYARINGEIWLLTVTRVVRTDGAPSGVADEDLPRQIRGVRTGHLAAEIAEQFSLSQVHIVNDAQDASADFGSLPLDLVESSEQAALVWAPPQPGSRILRQIAAPLAGILAAFFIAAILLSRYAVKAARRLETALVEAKAADRAKSQFLGVVSHELRTPMNGIIGLGQLLQAEDLDERHRTLLSTMMSCAESQMRLIEALLDIAQIESGKRSLNIAAFNPSRLLADVAEVARLACERKGLSFALHDETDAEASILGDRQALRQLITNLVDNAIKFTQSGSVTMRAAATRRGATALEYRISVEDTGIGVDPLNHKRIFQHLTQVDSSTTRIAGGLGLGLSICRWLSEMMGGEILVESALGAGSTFTFVVTLPVAEGAPALRAA